MPDASLDSMVTDPPAGIAFMGKDWDKDKGGRDGWVAWMTSVMRECHRVLKPGAHALVWAIPRTSHWTTWALEDAGFEIRDVVTHLFGTGFPKSLDISKAIDKAAGAKRKVIGVYTSPEGTSGRSDGSGSNFGIGGLNPITAPATPDAAKWQGFGTALKPACEFWILCRKPIAEKTVASNVLKYGTGALNIDGCRIETFETLTSGRHVQANREYPSGYKDVNRTEFVQNVSGRFPANLVLSHNEDCDETCTGGCAVRMLDEQSGELGNAHRPNRDLETFVKAGNITRQGMKKLAPTYEGTGGASRFFYCAKASKADRGPDNTHPTVKSTKLMGYLCRLVTPPGGTVLDPFAGSGSTGVAARSEGFAFVGIEQDPTYFEIASKRLA
jgi:site-specific DNA-methyltransferase (adenine-specific)